CPASCPWWAASWRAWWGNRGPSWRWSRRGGASSVRGRASWGGGAGRRGRGRHVDGRHRVGSQVVEDLADDRGRGLGAIATLVDLADHHVLGVGLGAEPHEPGGRLLAVDAGRSRLPAEGEGRLVPALEHLRAGPARDHAFEASQ